MFSFVHSFIHFFISLFFFFQFYPLFIKFHSFIHKLIHLVTQAFLALKERSLRFQSSWSAGQSRPRPRVRPQHGGHGRWNCGGLKHLDGRVRHWRHQNEGKSRWVGSCIWSCNEAFYVSEGINNQDKARWAFVACEWSILGIRIKTNQGGSFA